jgi:hypothetical protein
MSRQQESLRQRLEVLFLAMEKGMSTEQAYKELEDPLRKRGRNSERRVSHALARMDDVREVHVMEQNSEPDHQGIDMAIDVVLDPSNPMKTTKLNVQVKSSPLGIEQFQEELGKRNGIDPIDSQQIAAEMARQGIILINGQGTFFQIQQSFLAQLYAYKEYNCR